MDVTYPHVGATAGELPEGYRHVRRRVRLGSGAQTFTKAAEYVRAWGVHTGVGFEVRAEGTPHMGQRFAVLLKIGPLRILAPGEIVWHEHTERRYGYAFGTLQGHPESGEEAFLVERDAADVVWFTITAFSRPARWYSRLGYPMTCVVQDWVTNRYVKAVRKAARDAP